MGGGKCSCDCCRKCRADPTVVGQFEKDTEAEPRESGKRLGPWHFRMAHLLDSDWNHRRAPFSPAPAAARRDRKIGPRGSRHPRSELRSVLALSCHRVVLDTVA
jgi:hypothetical protein